MNLKSNSFSSVQCWLHSMSYGLCWNGSYMCSYVPWDDHMSKVYSFNYSNSFNWSWGI